MQAYTNLCMRAHAHFSLWRTCFHAVRTSKLLYWVELSTQCRFWLCHIESRAQMKRCVCGGGGGEGGDEARTYRGRL